MCIMAHGANFCTGPPSPTRSQVTRRDNYNNNDNWCKVRFGIVGRHRGPQERDLKGF